MKSQKCYVDDIIFVSDICEMKMMEEIKTCNGIQNQIFFQFIVIFRVLEDRISRLHGHLQRLLHLQHQQQTAVGSHGDALNTAHINILHEDIHWIVLVAGMFYRY